MLSPSEALQMTYNLFMPVKSQYEIGYSLPIICIICVLYLIPRLRKYRIYTLFAGVVFGFISYYIPAVGMIMNGFGPVYYRWMFIAYFAFGVLVAKLFGEISEGITQQGKAFVGLAALWLGLSVIYSGKISIQIVIYAMVWMGYILLGFLTSKDVSRTLLIKGTFIVTLGNICLNPFLLHAQKWMGGFGAYSNYETKNGVDGAYYDSKLFAIADEDTDTDYYRYDFSDSKWDASIMRGINTTSSYYSMTNGKLIDFYREMNLSYDNLSVFQFRGLNSRQILESLLSVKKYAEGAYNGDSIVDNDYFLPQGIILDKYITEAEIQSLSPVEKQGVLLDTVILADSYNVGNTRNAGNGYVKHINNTSIEDTVITEVPLDISLEGNVICEGTKYTVEDYAEIHLAFESQEQVDGVSCELYLCTKEPLVDRMVYIDDAQIFAGEYWYYKDKPFCMCVDYANENGKIVIKLPRTGEYNISDLKLYVARNEKFLENYERLSSHTLHDLMWTSKDSFKGTIDEAYDGLLFINLPYSAGWTCLIDGEKTNIVLADYAFMAIDIPSGEHIIEFRYRTPGLLGGLIVSLVSASLLVIMIQKNSYNFISKQKQQYELKN
jgi:uncharacterized membrane protein YfhO